MRRPSELWVLLSTLACVEAAAPWHRDRGTPPPPPTLPSSLPPPPPPLCRVGCGGGPSHLSYSCSARHIAPTVAYAYTRRSNGSRADQMAAEDLACGQLGATLLASSGSTLTVDCGGTQGGVIGCFISAGLVAAAEPCSMCKAAAEGGGGGGGIGCASAAYVPATVGNACIGQPSCTLQVTGGGRVITARGVSASLVNATGHPIAAAASVQCHSGGSRHLRVLAYCSVQNSSRNTVCSAKGSDAFAVARVSTALLTSLLITISQL